jgi:hypothetical protein
MSNNSGQCPVHMAKHYSTTCDLHLASFALKFASAQYHNCHPRTSALPRRHSASVARVNHLFPFPSSQLRKYHVGRPLAPRWHATPASPTKVVTLMTNPQHKDNAILESQDS